MQRAKEAGVIGIVVGTLGVQRYSSVVRSLRRMIEDAGRKAYTLAVGKVNVAKLANFAEVGGTAVLVCAFFCFLFWFLHFLYRCMFWFFCCSFFAFFFFLPFSVNMAKLANFAEVGGTASFVCVFSP